MSELAGSHIEKIISLLKKGNPQPEHYKDALISYFKKPKPSSLFDTQKEYELIYADKEREEVILADSMAVPLQKVKTFKNGGITFPLVEDNEGRNGIIFCGKECNNT